MGELNAGSGMSDETRLRLEPRKTAPWALGGLCRLQPITNTSGGAYRRASSQLRCLFPALIDAASSSPLLFFERIQERHRRSLPGVLSGHPRLVAAISHPYPHG
jgi:hypothetical protein